MNTQTHVDIPATEETKEPSLLLMNLLPEADTAQDAAEASGCCGGGACHV